jgi:hypothetical protein
MHLRLLVLAALLGLPTSLEATEWFVQPAGAGDGTRTAPFARIQDAIDAAQPGDIVSILPGTYPEALRSVRHGTSAKPIVIRAVEGRGSALVTGRHTILAVAHAHHRVDGLVMDAQYAAADAVIVRTSGHHLVLRNSEIRRTAKDAIDIAAAEGVLIEDTLIHHALNAAGGRTDAHGIAAGAVRDLTIRRTEIHTFSGDAIQVDPGRAAPGWSDVTIEGCRLWLQPLPEAQNGFAAGVVPGENALDTKAANGLPRARIVVRDTVAFGFRNGLISNMAAFNLKENIDATLDAITVYDSEIAFRVRGAGRDRAGAIVGVRNAVIHSTTTAFRYEEGIENFRIWNTTIGRDVARPFLAASTKGTLPDVRNLLLLGSALPPEASRRSNMTTGPASFKDVQRHDYTLMKGAAAVDSGESLAEVTTDRRGLRRPQGLGWDVGAFERSEGQGSEGGQGTVTASGEGVRRACASAHPALDQNEMVIQFEQVDVPAAHKT